MAPKKPPAATPAGLELDSLFEQELRAQNEDLRRMAALATFYKLHPSNRVTVEQFLVGLKQNKDIWAVVATLGVVDFAEALLGNRSVGTKAPRDARPTKGKSFPTQVGGSAGVPLQDAIRQRGRARLDGQTVGEPQ